MSKAQELGLIVAQARNKETIRQCKALYAALIDRATEGAHLGSHKIKGTIELDPNEKYEEIIIVNQLGLRLKAEEFQDVCISVSVGGQEVRVHEMSFSFTIPKVTLLEQSLINFGF